MKKKYIFIILLFFVFFCSCSLRKDINKYYREMTQEQDRKSTLLYMLLSETKEEKLNGLPYFKNQGFSDSINVLLIDPADSLESAITVYQSYTKLSQDTKAKSILSDYIIKALSMKDVVTLLVNYPVDSDYMTTMFGLWQTSVENEDKEDFLTLIKRFYKNQQLTESSAKTLFDITSRMEEDSYYSEDYLKLADIYEIKSDILKLLKDDTNSKAFKRLSDSLREQQ